MSACVLLNDYVDTVEVQTKEICKLRNEVQCRCIQTIQNRIKFRKVFFVEGNLRIKLESVGSKNNLFWKRESDLGIVPTLNAVDLVHLLHMGTISLDQ